MRTYSYILLTVLLCIGSGMRAVAQSGPMEGLVGSWTLDYGTTFSNMEGQRKAALDTVPQAQRTGIENSYRGRTMVFGPDGGFSMQFLDGRSVGGRWSLEQDGSMLVLTDPNGHRYSHRVKGLTASGLVLRAEDMGEGELFVKELYFIKN